MRGISALMDASLDANERCIVACPIDLRVDVTRGASCRVYQGEAGYVLHFVSVANVFPVDVTRYVSENVRRDDVTNDVRSVRRVQLRQMREREKRPDVRRKIAIRETSERQAQERETHPTTP